MELDGLLAVDEHGRVESAELGEGHGGPVGGRAPGPALAGDDGEGREDALGLAGAVLGGELQLEAGVEGARAHTEGVEQGVGRGPGPLEGRGGRSFGSRVDRHGPIIAPNDVTLKLS